MNYTYILVLLFINGFLIISCKSETSEEDQSITTKKSYYLSGDIRIEQQFKNDSIKHGFYKEYYKNGQLKAKVKFKNGNREDTAYFYYRNGNIKTIQAYSGGIVVGLTINYDSLGNIATKYTIINNTTHGPAVYFHKNGIISYYLYYDQDREVKYRSEYDSSGRLLVENGTPFPELIVNQDCPNNNCIMEVGDTFRLTINVIDPPHGKPNLYIGELNENNKFIDSTKVRLKNDQYFFTYTYEEIWQKPLEFKLGLFLKIISTDPKANTRQLVPINIRVES